ncbi:hypothetical protein MRBLMS1_002871 [Massilia sp. LMS1-1-1.1]
MKLTLKTKLAAFAICGAIGISAVLISKTISPSEWAAWVQAVGSIAALLITGGLFLLQREVEDQKAEDARLQSRTIAAQNVTSVAFQAVQAMSDAANEHEAATEHGAFEESATRLDHLRAVLDSFITPATDHVCVTASLHLGLLLTQARADFQNHNHNYGMLDHIHTRSAERVRKAEKFRDRLIDHKSRLISKCNERGIILSGNDIDV